MRKQCGTALIEFALVVPCMLMLTFLVIECGRAIQHYNGVTKSVRDAARYLSVQRQGTGALAARNLVVYGRIDGAGPPLDPALTLDMVQAPTWATIGSDPLINTVTIKVKGYQFKPIVGAVFGMVLPQMNFNDISATMRCPL